MWQRFWRSQDGATAIEYGLIAAGISLAIMATVFAFGQVLYDLFYSGLPDILG